MSWNPGEVQHLRAAVEESFAVLEAEGDPLVQDAMRLRTREILAHRVYVCAERGETNENRLIIYALAGLRPRSPEPSSGIGAAR